jgi:hypothetical protein
LAMAKAAACISLTKSGPPRHDTCRPQNQPSDEREARPARPAITALGQDAAGGLNDQRSQTAVSDGRIKRQGPDAYRVLSVPQNPLH